MEDLWEDQHRIQVPGNWQLQGYDRPQYVLVKLNGTPGLTGEVSMPEFCSAASGTLR